MSKTSRKAEEAALNGEGQEFDTQHCVYLQELILSSSPHSLRIAADEESTLSLEPTIIDETALITSDLSSHLKTRQESTLPADEEAPRPNNTAEQQAEPNQDRADDDSTTRGNLTQIRRDGRGKLRPFDNEGKEQTKDFHHKYHKEIEGTRKAMDEFTQKSSLSPTQANSESAYRVYNELPCNQLTFTPDGVAGEGEEGDEDPLEKGPASVGSKQQHHSAVTDSTAYTYGENDTGHVNLVNLDFPIAPENQEIEENISQDASFAPRPPLSNEFSYEPRTPAPANPFSQKGSVMKGHEMFGATQPSSIGRHIASPTSSRPSPDIYNNSSPQKRMTTSPLERHGDEQSILQSSVRTLLRSKSTESSPRIETPQATSSRSFDSKGARREPRDIYVSTKESQERRQRASSASDSEPESESDAEVILLKRQSAARDAKIQRQLAQVTSSRPASGTSGEVEVPASGRRRRSVDDDYIPQCNGTDGRDAPQDDVIIDSQAIVEEPEAINLPEATIASQQATSQAEPIRSPKSSPQLPARRSSVEPHRVPDLYPTSQTEDPSTPLKDPASQLQQQSLPLQEVSTNRNDLKTPIGSKGAQVLSDGADTTIPNTILETSPLGEDQIRPMGEVTSLSFTDNTFDDALVDQAPGFTQDVEFNNAINPRLSPTPPPRTRAKDKRFPSFEDAVTTVSVIARESVGHGLPNTDIVVASGKLQKDGLEGNEDKSTEASDDTTKVVAFNEPQKTSAEGNENERLDGSKEQVDSGEDHGEEETVAPPEVEGINKPDEQNKPTVHAPHNRDTPNQPQKRATKGSTVTPKLPQEPAARRGGLRSKEELKGPSKALRRSEETVTPKAPSQRPSQVTKSTSAAKTNSAPSSKRVSGASSVFSTPLSSLGSTPAPSTRSFTRKNVAASRVNNATPAPAPKTCKPPTRARLAKEETSVRLPQQRSLRRSTLQAKEVGDHTPASIPPTRSSKRKSAVLDDEEPYVTRVSKRQSTAHVASESSGDLLIYPTSTLNVVSRTKKFDNLFTKMAFAVSYVKQDKEKSQVTDLITEHGGRILHDGFEKLFEPSSLFHSRGPAADENDDLTLTATARSIGFVALIADEHSRKAKYMQALALGLPCISGRWILACVAKGEIIDWNSYLLCAGQSTFLGNAIRSRTLGRYSATEARFAEILSSREKLLDGKSILLVTAKGKEDARKAYVFLTRALGPARIGQVSDHEQARKKLLEDETWDLLYVDKNENAAEVAVFGSFVSRSSGSKKRKRGPTAAEQHAGPAPKRIRLISDEVIIQSLILGQLLEEGA